MVPTFIIRSFDRGGVQLCPLQHRHTYAVDFQCGLPDGEANRPKSSPPQERWVRAALQPISVRLELAGLT